MGQGIKPVRPIEYIRLFGNPFHIAGGQAEPAHAGVDMQHGGERATGRDAHLADPGDLPEIVDHRDQAVFRENLLGALQQAVQHGDSGIGKQAPQGDAFIDRGNEKCPAPGFEQGRPNPVHAGAIGIRLHGRAAFDAAEPLFQIGIVLFDCAEIDQEFRRGAGTVDRRKGVEH